MVFLYSCGRVVIVNLVVFGCIVSVVGSGSFVSCYWSGRRRNFVGVDVVVGSGVVFIMGDG